ncbi:MAG: DUF367 family protein [Nitrososphaeraceae archaeon]|jgi:pre-rRNA-processing protein TSR3
MINHMRAYVLLLKQDDPKKCTALRLVKTGLACPIQSLANDMIVLNPFANRVLCKTDSSMATSMCGIDCSWNLAESVLKISRFTNKGILRRVPSLLAGNPINYSKLGRLSTVEALSGCYYIMGFKDVAQLMLNKFKWGHTFLELNRNALDDYNLATNPGEIAQIEEEYFGNYKQWKEYTVSKK